VDLTSLGAVFRISVSFVKARGIWFFQRNIFFFKQKSGALFYKYFASIGSSYKAVRVTVNVSDVIQTLLLGTKYHVQSLRLFYIIPH